MYFSVPESSPWTTMPSTTRTSPSRDPFRKTQRTRPGGGMNRELENCKFFHSYLLSISIISFSYYLPAKMTLPERYRRSVAKAEAFLVCSSSFFHPPQVPNFITRISLTLFSLFSLPGDLKKNHPRMMTVDFFCHFWNG